MLPPKQIGLAVLFLFLKEKVIELMVFPKNVSILFLCDNLLLGYLKICGRCT